MPDSRLLVPISLPALPALVVAAGERVGMRFPRVDRADGLFLARIGAPISMTVEDVCTQNRRLWVRLREKGGKRHAMQRHHNLDEYLLAHLDGANLRDDPKRPLFRTIGRGTTKLTRTVLPQANAYAMIRRRARRRHRDRARQSQLPGDRDHRLSEEGRHTRKGCGDGEPRVDPDDAAR